MFCASCGTEISNNAAACPKCGVAVAGNGLGSQPKVQIPNHMMGAILSAIFCCQIGGIIAIVYACKVNTKIAQGDVAGAQAASKVANNWIIANVVIGIIVGLIYFIAALAE